MFRERSFTVLKFYFRILCSESFPVCYFLCGWWECKHHTLWWHTLTDGERAPLSWQFRPDAYGHKLVPSAGFADVCSFVWVNVLILDVTLLKLLSVGYCGLLFLTGHFSPDAAESWLSGETAWGCELAGGLGLKIALYQSGFSALPCVERFSHFHPKQCNKTLSQPFHLEIPHPPKQILKCRFWPMHIPVISTD